MTGKISEIFESIQGEGVYFGQKQIFVRLFGCNLKCGYCDTALTEFKEYTASGLCDELKNYSGSFHSVSFTGGEPLLQADFLKEALALTRKAGFKNYLETNGTLPEALEEVIDNVDFVSMDFKFPSSTGSGDHWAKHGRFLEISARKEVFIKAVICGSTREDDLLRGIKMIQELSPQCILVLQPNSAEDELNLKDKLDVFSNICFRENINFEIIPQMHKLMGVR